MLWLMMAILTITITMQYPHEEEMLWPPLTTLSTVTVDQRGAKRCVTLSVDVSTAGDVHRPGTPT